MAPERVPFTVNLSPGLIEACKRAALDGQLSLSDWTQQALGSALGMDGDRAALQPMVHVADMGAAVAFYEALGAAVVNGSRDGDFVLLRLGAAEFSLLAHPANPEDQGGAVELNFVASDLEAVQAAVLRAAGEVVRPPSDEAFGRQLVLRAPGGLLVKVNQLDPSLYA